jgi:hypothetical protein
LNGAALHILGKRHRLGTDKMAGAAKRLACEGYLNVGRKRGPLGSHSKMPFAVAILGQIGRY